MMQVLNGLLSRTDQKEAISIPIGIIPTGSDNSLVWTVLGIRDPISAALAIVKVSNLWFTSSLTCRIFALPLLKSCCQLLNMVPNFVLFYFKVTWNAICDVWV